MKKLITLSLIIGILFSGCGKSVGTKENDLTNRIKSLEIISGSLEAVVNSDFSSCPNSGDTADALIRKICAVAQAATVEAKVELKAQLAAFSQSLQNQIDVINSELVSKQVSIDTINAQITVINGTLTTLGTRMDNAESAITALQSLTNSINGTLNGTMVSFDIGTENVSAGPLYETLLRRVDKKRINGYVIAYGASQGLGSNPLTAANGSSTITVSLTAHGYVVGDRVELNDLVGGRGHSNGHVYGVFTVLTAAANSFTISSLGTGSSNGTFGSSSGSVRKVSGQGMGTLWVSDQVSDSAVRVTNLGTKRYNFIIRRIASDVSNDTAQVCWSKTDNLATFATINAAPEAGNASITCY